MDHRNRRVSVVVRYTDPVRGSRGRRVLRLVDHGVESGSFDGHSMDHRVVVEYDDGSHHDHRGSRLEVEVDLGVRHSSLLPMEGSRRGGMGEVSVSDIDLRNLRDPKVFHLGSGNCKCRLVRIGACNSHIGDATDNTAFEVVLIKLLNGNLQITSRLELDEPSKSQRSFFPCPAQNLPSAIALSTNF